MSEPLRIPEDRSIAVAPGRVVVTQYVSVDVCILACRDRMAIGDVERAYHRRLTNAPAQPWPCPRGYWDTQLNFVIVDGRHDYIAALMLGFSHILVAFEQAAEDRGTFHVNV